MAENPKLSAINIGGKGAYLTSTSIFSIANKVVQSLRDAFKVSSDATFEEEYVNLVKSVVLWELVTAFMSLEGIDLLERKQGDAKVDKKKKKKKVLGKGTGVVLQLIKDRFAR